MPPFVIAWFVLWTMIILIRVVAKVVRDTEGHQAEPVRLSWLEIDRPLLEDWERRFRLAVGPPPANPERDALVAEAARCLKAAQGRFSDNTSEYREQEMAKVRRAHAALAWWQEEAAARFYGATPPPRPDCAPDDLWCLAYWGESEMIKRFWQKGESRWKQGRRLPDPDPDPWYLNEANRYLDEMRQRP